jgi:DNA polymerase
MFMRLPSGRAIVYPYPCLKKKLMPWTKTRLSTTSDYSYEDPVWKESICYQGLDTFTRKWSDQFAHGGLLCNNAVQGTARDIEAEAMFRVERAGYPIVLTVHDEVVCETPKDFGSVEEFEKLMTELPVWAKGLPLAAGAWSAERYRK